MSNDITVTRFAGRTASVNAWLVANRTHAVLIDALRDEREAAELADTIESTGRTLHAIVVTHGHPDHYIGLRTLRERFPAARTLVASAAIKEDVIGFSTWMEGVGWLDAIPRMKVRSRANPDGFDYAASLEVLATPTLDLPGGGRLHFASDYPATEAAHMTTIFVPDANALFTADLVYNDVHAWLGQGVSVEDAHRWIAVLAELKARYADRNVTIYPGHGAAGGLPLLDRIRSYLLDFLAAAASSASNAGMTDRLTALYPGYEQVDFLLAHSVRNHGPDAHAAG